MSVEFVCVRLFQYNQKSSRIHLISDHITSASNIFFLRESSLRELKKSGIFSSQEQSQVEYLRARRKCWYTVRGRLQHIKTEGRRDDCRKWHLALRVIFDNTWIRYFNFVWIHSLRWPSVQIKHDKFTRCTWQAVPFVLSIQMNWNMTVSQ